MDAESKKIINLSEFNLNYIGRIVKEIATERGFYDSPNPIPQRVALIHEEVSEILRADREGRDIILGRETIQELLSENNDELYYRRYRRYVKDTIPQEVAGAIVRLLDLAADNDIDIHAHVAAEIRFNSLRERMHGKKY